MARRKRQYGDMSSTEARAKARFTAYSIKSTRQAFHSNLKRGYCHLALKNLTGIVESVSTFSVYRDIAAGRRPHGRPIRAYNFDAQIHALEKKFIVKCGR